MTSQLSWRYLIRTCLMIALVVPSVLATCSVAGEFNPLLKIGDAAPAWKELPGVDEKKHSLDDLKSKDVVVVVFTCNSCPYAVDYENRINTLAQKYSAPDSKVAVVAINVNKIDADLMPEMKKRAKEKDFKFPYIYDETQQIAKSFGAARTPEFFVLNKERRVVYMGAMDDNSKQELVKRHFVEDAIAAVLKGESVTVIETPPVGCAIRYVRERKPSKASTDAKP